MSVISTRSNYGDGSIRIPDHINKKLIGLNPRDGLYYQYVDGYWVLCAMQDPESIAKAIAYGLYSAISYSPASPIDEQHQVTTNVHSPVHYDCSADSPVPGVYATGALEHRTEGRSHPPRADMCVGQSDVDGNNGYHYPQGHYDQCTDVHTEVQFSNAGTMPVYDSRGCIDANYFSESSPPPSDDYRASIARCSNQFLASTASQYFGHGIERNKHVAIPQHSTRALSPVMANDPAYHMSISPTPVVKSQHIDDTTHMRQQRFVTDHRPSAQYPPTHQHLMEHLPSPSPYTTFPTPAATLTSQTPSPQAHRAVAYIEPADTAARDAKEAEWQRAAALARQNPPVPPTSSPPSSSASRQSIQKLSTMRKNADKKQTLACLFCRERKIACGRPSPDNPDQTCNQCARRNLCCEYPKESRRGQHKRIPRKLHTVDAL